jgi:hypothetical protein
MRINSPDELELGFFFECEATFVDPESTWPNVTADFETNLSGYRVRFQIQPAFSTMKVSLATAGKEIADAQISNFSALELISEGGREMLVATFGEMDHQQMWLTLKPEVQLKFAV